MTWKSAKIIGLLKECDLANGAKPSLHRIRPPKSLKKWLSSCDRHLTVFPFVQQSERQFTLPYRAPPSLRIGLQSVHCPWYLSNFSGETLGPACSNSNPKWSVGLGGAPHSSGGLYGPLNETMTFGIKQYTPFKAIISETGEYTPFKAISETGDSWLRPWKFNFTTFLCRFGRIPIDSPWSYFLLRPWPPESCCSSHSTANLRPMACHFTGAFFGIWQLAPCSPKNGKQSRYWIFVSNHLDMGHLAFLDVLHLPIKNPQTSLPKMRRHSASVQNPPHFEALGRSFTWLKHQ